MRERESDRSLLSLDVMATLVLARPFRPLLAWRNRGDSRPPTREAPSATPSRRETERESGVLGAAAFYDRLLQEIVRARREQSSLSVMVFQVPEFPEDRQQKRRELEIALRLGLGPEDGAGRLGAGTIAVATGQPFAAAMATAQRLEPLLSRLAEAPVTGGVASYPYDGREAIELIRTACWRSLAAYSLPRQGPEMEWLLGPLAPPRPPAAEGEVAAPPAALNETA